MYLEDGVRLGVFPAAGGAPMRGALQIVLAVQPHLRGEHISHDHKAHLRAHALARLLGHEWEDITGPLLVQQSRKIDEKPHGSMHNSGKLPTDIL